MTDAEILAAAAVLAGGACHSATGFGFALLAAPPIVAALPPRQAVATIVVVATVASLLTLLTERRVPEPLWGESARLLAFGAAGALAGSLVLAELDRTALQLLVTVSVLAALAARRLARRGGGTGDAGRRWLPAAGLSAGVLTTTTTTNGPPLVLYLLGRGLSAARVRDTLSVLFVAFGAIGAAVLFLGKPDASLPDAATMAVLAAAAAVGHVAGRPVFARLATDGYDRVVTVLLLISVATGALVALV